MRCGLNSFRPEGSVGERDAVIIGREQYVILYIGESHLHISDFGYLLRFRRDCPCGHVVYTLFNHIEILEAVIEFAAARSVAADHSGGNSEQIFARAVDCAGDIAVAACKRQCGAVLRCGGADAAPGGLQFALAGNGDGRKVIGKLQKVCRVAEIQSHSADLRDLARSRLYRRGRHHTSVLLDGIVGHDMPVHRRAPEEHGKRSGRDIEHIGARGYESHGLLYGGVLPFKLHVAPGIANATGLDDFRHARGHTVHTRIGQGDAVCRHNLYALPARAGESDPDSAYLGNVSGCRGERIR